MSRLVEWFVERTVTLEEFGEHLHVLEPQGVDSRSQGLQDVIMNTLTTNGIVGRFVTDWTGPDAIIKRCALKLGVPNVPGETMKLTGSVKEKDDGAGTLVLEVVGSNSWGDHVNAAVTVALPKGAS